MSLPNSASPHVRMVNPALSHSSISMTRFLPAAISCTTSPIGLKDRLREIATVHVITAFIHTGATYRATNAKAKENLPGVAKGAGKKISFKCWRIAELEDRLWYSTNSDVLRPKAPPTDPVVQAYIASLQVELDAAKLKYKKEFTLRWREGDGIGQIGVFSSGAARSNDRRTAFDCRLRGPPTLSLLYPECASARLPISHLTRIRWHGCHLSKLPEQLSISLVGWRPLVPAVSSAHKRPDIHGNHFRRVRAMKSPASQLRVYSRAEVIPFRSTKEKFGGLSNMAPGFPLLVNGITIRTSEALYQACRFPHMPEIQRMIIGEKSPMTAKMVSKPHREQSRSDWQSVRVKIMRWCLRLKLAQNWQTFGELLYSSGDLPIVEDSRKDDFWGAKADENGNLVGQNILGRLLMELRDQLRGPTGNELRKVALPEVKDLWLYSQPVTYNELAEASTAATDKNQLTEQVLDTASTIENKKMIFYPKAPHRSRSAHQAHLCARPAREIHSAWAHFYAAHLVGATTVGSVSRGDMRGTLAGPG